VQVTAANGVGENAATSAATGAVPQLPTTLTLTASALQVPVGGNDTFSATVAPTVNGGTVTFSDRGGVLCGPITVNTSMATATCVGTVLSSGTDTVTATYSGDVAHAGSTASVSLTLGSPTTSTPPTVVPVPAKVTFTSIPSDVLGTQLFVYRETGDVNTTHCWLDRVVISCGASEIMLHNLSAGTHRFEVLVDGDDSQSYDTDVWTIRAAAPTPGHLHARVVKRRGTVTWNAVRGASGYVITETVKGIPHTTTSHARTLRLTVTPHTPVTVAVHAVTAEGRPGANAVITVR
jgi:Bacterial Ig-like domain (group 3)